MKRESIISRIKEIRKQMKQAEEEFSVYYHHCEGMGVPSNEMDEIYAEFSHGQGILERELEALEEDLYRIDYFGESN